MNREAALLGIPVYSIFGGKKAALDIELNKLGRLQFINQVHDYKYIEFKKKTMSGNLLKTNVKKEIIEAILKFAD